MENVYTAYVKEITDQNFYFVKKFNCFPELPDVEPILESMGMHPDFYKACELAKLEDSEIIKKLYNQLHILPDTATALPEESHSIFRNILKETQHALVRLRVAGI